MMAANLKKDGNGSATEQVQVSPRLHEPKTTASELSDQPAQLEVPNTDANENASIENQTDDSSPNLEKKLETSEGTSNLPTNKALSLRGRRGKGRRTRKIVVRNPTASAAGQSTGELPEEPATTEPQEEEEQPSPAVTNGDAINTSNDGIFVGIANDANPENKSSKDEIVAPKRKRGRPFGSLSGSVIGNKSDASETSTAIGAARGKPTRDRRGVYESAMNTLRPKVKKSKIGKGVSAPTKESEVKDKAEDPTRNSTEEISAPVSDGATAWASDEDRPLSTWIADADNARPREDDNVKPLPFSKTSPIWKMVESLDVFQKIPQNPHFEPLFDAKENIREGLAIGNMVTFSSLAEKISKIKFEDPPSSFEACMESFSDLEIHGFNVEPLRKRLNILLYIKNRHDHAMKVSAEITEQIKERAKLDERIKHIDRKIARLNEKKSVAVVEKERKDTEIGELQARFASMSEAVDGAGAKFETLAKAAW